MKVTTTRHAPLEVLGSLGPFGIIIFLEKIVEPLSAGLSMSPPGSDIAKIKFGTTPTTWSSTVSIQIKLGNPYSPRPIGCSRYGRYKWRGGRSRLLINIPSWSTSFTGLTSIMFFTLLRINFFGGEIMRFLSAFNVIGRRIAIIYRLHSTRNTNNTIVRTTIPARWFNHSYAASTFQDIPILDSHIVFAT